MHGMAPHPCTACHTQKTNLGRGNLFIRTVQYKCLDQRYLLQESKTFVLGKIHFEAHSGGSVNSLLSLPLGCGAQKNKNFLFPLFCPLNPFLEPLPPSLRPDPTRLHCEHAPPPPFFSSSLKGIGSHGLNFRWRFGP